MNPSEINSKCVLLKKNRISLRHSIRNNITAISNEKNNKWGVPESKPRRVPQIKFTYFY